MRLRDVAANNYLKVARRSAGFLARLISRGAYNVNLVSDEDRLARDLARRANLRTGLVITRIAFGLHFQYRNYREISGGGICHQ